MPLGKVWTVVGEAWNITWKNPGSCFQSCSYWISLHSQLAFGRPALPWHQYWTLQWVSPATSWVTLLLLTLLNSGIAKVNSKGYYGLWVTIICQGTLRWGMLIMEQAMHVWLGGFMANLCTFLSIFFFFFWKQKTVLQNIFKKKTSDIAQASTFGSLPTLPHSILVPWSTNSPLCNHSNFLELKCGHVASD